MRHALGPSPLLSRAHRQPAVSSSQAVIVYTLARSQMPSGNPTGAPRLRARRSIANATAATHGKAMLTARWRPGRPNPRKPEAEIRAVALPATIASRAPRAWSCGPPAACAVSGREQADQADADAVHGGTRDEGIPHPPRHRPRDRERGGEEEEALQHEVRVDERVKRRADGAPIEDGAADGDAEIADVVMGIAVGRREGPSRRALARQVRRGRRKPRSGGEARRLGCQTTISNSHVVIPIRRATPTACHRVRQPCSRCREDCLREIDYGGIDAGRSWATRAFFGIRHLAPHQRHGVTSFDRVASCLLSRPTRRRRSAPRSRRRASSSWSSRRRPPLASMIGNLPIALGRGNGARHAGGVRHRRPDVAAALPSAMPR